MGGLENLSLIPGTAGAAPLQNIGAYGVEVKDVIEYVDTIDLSTGQSNRFSNKECQFQYRESVLSVPIKKYFISKYYFKVNQKESCVKDPIQCIAGLLQQHKIITPTIRGIRAVIAVTKQVAHLIRGSR